MVMVEETDNHDKSTDLEYSIVESIRNSPETHDLVVSYAELGLEAITDSELIDQIPVLNTLVALGKAALSIRDRIFAKKMLRLLSGLGLPSSEDIERWKEELGNERSQKKFGGGNSYVN